VVCFDHIRFRFPLRKNFSPPLDGRIQLSILPRSPSDGWQRQDDYSIAQMSHILCSPLRWQRAETILGTPSRCLNSALRRSKHHRSNLSRRSVPRPDAPKRNA
jgi:hypothetical protein